MTAISWDGAGRPSKPLELTSYDVFKSIAVLLMIVDHIGQYFFPDLLWFKVFGRFCVPIWFFLVGFARSRDLSPRLWIGAVILIGADALLGRDLFPLNILVSILLVRLLINPIMRWMIKGPYYFWGIAAALFILVVPTYPWVEYGSLGVILAMFGFVMRSQDRALMMPAILFSFLAYVLSQQVMLQFSHLQFVVMALGSLGVFGMLYTFKSQIYAKKLPESAVQILQFGGRRTLEIYVIHLLIFKLMAFIIHL